MLRWADMLGSDSDEDIEDLPKSSRSLTATEPVKDKGFDQSTDTTEDAEYIGSHIEAHVDRVHLPQKDPQRERKDHLEHDDTTQTHMTSVDAVNREEEILELQSSSIVSRSVRMESESALPEQGLSVMEDGTDRIDDSLEEPQADDLPEEQQKLTGEADSHPQAVSPLNQVPQDELVTSNAMLPASVPERKCFADAARPFNSTSSETSHLFAARIASVSPPEKSATATATATPSSKHESKTVKSLKPKRSTAPSKPLSLCDFILPVADTSVQALSQRERKKLRRPIPLPLSSETTTIPSIQSHGDETPVQHVEPSGAMAFLSINTSLPDARTCVRLPQHQQKQPPQSPPSTEKVPVSSVLFSAMSSHLRHRRVKWCGVMDAELTLPPRPVIVPPPHHSAARRLSVHPCNYKQYFSPLSPVARPGNNRKSNKSQKEKRHVRLQVPPPPQPPPPTGFVLPTPDDSFASVSSSEEQGGPRRSPSARSAAELSSLKTNCFVSPVVIHQFYVKDGGSGFLDENKPDERQEILRRIRAYYPHTRHLPSKLLPGDADIDPVLTTTTHPHLVKEMAMSSGDHADTAIASPPPDLVSDPTTLVTQPPILTPASHETTPWTNSTTHTTTSTLYSPPTDDIAITVEGVQVPKKKKNNNKDNNSFYHGYSSE